MPKVTVIIPSYNHGKFIGETINSVLTQSFQDFELLIIDDCSTDNSVEIISKFNDPRIKLIVNEQNQGAAYGHNLMLDMAQGEYIALINSDDIWLPHKLKQQVLFLDKNQSYGAVFTNVEVIDESGNSFANKTHFYSSVFNQKNRTQVEWLQHFFYHGNCLCHPSSLIRKRIYLEVGNYNPLLGLVPDFELWIKIVAKYNIYVLPEKLITFRILNNENNASGSNLKNFVRGYFDHGKVLDAFCNITEIELFNKVFPDSPINVKEQIIFQFALICINDERIYAKNYGLNKLYELLYDNYLLYSQYISAQEFQQLVLNCDIYNIANLESGKFKICWAENKNGLSNEMQSLELAVNIITKSFSFKLPLIENLSKIWLFPLNNACKVKIKSIRLINEKNKTYNIIIKENNAHYIDENGFYVAYHQNLQLLCDIPSDLPMPSKFTMFIECDILGISKNECLAYINKLPKQNTVQSSNIKELIKKIKSRFNNLICRK